MYPINGYSVAKIDLILAETFDQPQILLADCFVPQPNTLNPSRCQVGLFEDFKAFAPQNENCKMPANKLNYKRNLYRVKGVWNYFLCEFVCY